VATLLSSGGVTAPSVAQNYAVLAPNGAAVARSFSFTANGTPGSVVTATLRVVDGTQELGDVVFQFPLGASARFVSTNSISIPDSGPALTYPSTIAVSGLAGVAIKVSVTLSNLTHSYPDDLDILLVSPSGRKVMLMSDVGGGVGGTNLTLTFDDSASASLPDSTGLSAGMFRATDFEPGDVMPLPAPAGPYATNLAAFVGGVANGEWSLYIGDDSFGDSGSLSGGWSLSLSTGSVNPLPPLLSAPHLPNKGYFSFTLTGQAGATYTIEGSDDLNTWTTVETITLVGTTYDYLTPTSAAHRFYRAWRVP
jgi:subtilisin-like proprotein convertase family protein